MSLRLSDIDVVIGDNHILESVDLDVVDGTVVAVLGPSGSGKTTLLRVIAGLQPATGRVEWSGVDLTGVPPHLRGFGLMFQDYALFPHRSVADNVAFGLEMRGDDPAAIAQRVAEVLGWVGLADAARRRVTSLSGGEQQRVALARTLAPAPKLLMLDEPVGSLDRSLRARLLAELGEILRREGITTLFVTHDQDEAFALADQVVVVRDGRIVGTGSPEELWHAPHDEWMARFLGMTNIVTGQDGQNVIRPEAIRIDPDGEIPAVVGSVAFNEGGYVVGVRTDEGDDLRFRTERRPTLGQRVMLTIDAQGVVPLEG